MGMSKEQTVEVKKLEEQGLKRYMVGIVSEVIERKTVYAHDPDEARQRIEQGQGAHAGQEGRVLGIISKEIGLDHNYSQGEFFKMYDALQAQIAKKIQEGQEHQGRIIVPKLVPPKDLVMP
jgi:hypothetical protein